MTDLAALRAEIEGLRDHWAGGYEWEWECAHRTVLEADGLPDCADDEPAHNDELVSRREVLAILNRYAAEPLDAETLLKAMEDAWPSHTEGSGGTGDVEQRHWQVLNPTLPNIHLAGAIVSKLPIPYGKNGLRLTSRTCGDRHCADRAYRWFGPMRARRAA